MDKKIKELIKKALRNPIAIKGHVKINFTLDTQEEKYAVIFFMNSFFKNNENVKGMTTTTSSLKDKLIFVMHDAEFNKLKEFMEDK